MDEWQPIETAPKTGEDILTFGNWGVMPAMWSGTKWFVGFEQVLEKCGYSYSFNPTHWMPLPNPPKN